MLNLKSRVTKENRLLIVRLGAWTRKVWMGYVWVDANITTFLSCAGESDRNADLVVPQGWTGRVGALDFSTMISLYDPPLHANYKALITKTTVCCLSYMERTARN
jgi:hypothetical protein